jgi:hypothetical protein
VERKARVWVFALRRERAQGYVRRAEQIADGIQVFTLGQQAKWTGACRVRIGIDCARAAVCSRCAACVACARAGTAAATALASSGTVVAAVASRANGRPARRRLVHDQ